jgi:hypothetical protein
LNVLKLPIAFLVIVAVANASPAATATSLAELAARERERRQGLSGPTAPLYTDDDLRRIHEEGKIDAKVMASEVTAPPPPGATRPTQVEGEGTKSEDEARRDREKAWRERLQKANEEVARLSQDVDRLQLGLNDLTQNLYSVGRRAQMVRLEEAKGQLVAARQSVEDIEEEGRRSSFRP